MVDIGNGHKPPEGFTWPGVARPAGWSSQPRETATAEEQTTTGESATLGEPASHGNQDRREQPAREAEPGPAGNQAWQGEPDWKGEPASPDEQDDWLSERERTGPTTVPGGPPFLTSWARTREGRSPWEQAQDVWRDCGVSWEQTDDLGDYAKVEQEGEWPQQDPGWPAAGEYRMPPDFSAPPAAWATGTAPQNAPQNAPLSAPTVADVAPELVSHGNDRETDEPWLVHRPARATRRRNKSPLHVLRIVIPIMLIAAVGTGAVVMLTGRTTVALESHTKKAPAKTQSTTPPMMNMAMFPAPGALPGTTVIEALASQGNGNTQIATGTAGTLAAIWQRTGAMSQKWTLVSRSPSIQGQLTSVTYGHHGWVAAGGSPHHPLVMTSADGTHWQVVSNEHSFRFGGEHVFGTAAGSAGYLVVGLILHHGRPVAADWWSTDRKYWQRGGNGGLDGRQATSQMRAAVATPGGFIAVGQHGRKPAAWMAGTAHDWMLMDLPMPAGASTALLTQVTANGERVVAIGDAVTSHGIVPFAVVTPDGGATWRESPLTTPGAHTTVTTAVTYTSAGFVAAGQMEGKAYYWTSADGTAWSMPKEAGNGITALTGLAPDGDQATGVGVMLDRPTVWTVRG